MKNLNYLMDHILYQMFKIIFNIYLKSMWKGQLIFQSEYIQTKQKIDSCLKLKQDINS